MNIIVITITARTEPRLEEMAATLAASTARSSQAKVTWIVVDELIGEPKRDARWHAIVDRHGHVIDDMARIPPLFTEHRHIDPEDEPTRPKRPAHNSARSAGLMMALAGLDVAELDDAYVVFLNDCAVVTADFIGVALEMGSQKLGWRCPSFLDHDVRVRIPENGELRWRDSSDSLHPVPPATVPGVCWGAPARALARIQGFDLSYDGEDKGHDLDAVLRLARVGVKFVTTKRACVVSLRRTKLRDEISTDRVAFAGARNQALLRRLAAEPLRVLPLERARRAAMDVPPPRSEPDVTRNATDGTAPEAVTLEPAIRTDGASPKDAPVMELPTTDGVVPEDAPVTPEEGAPNSTQQQDGASPEDAPQTTIGSDVDEQFDDGELDDEYSGL